MKVASLGHSESITRIVRPTDDTTHSDGGPYRAVRVRVVSVCVTRSVWKLSECQVSGDTRRPPSVLIRAEFSQP
jgi:hypothetical protein